MEKSDNKEQTEQPSDKAYLFSGEPDWPDCVPSLRLCFMIDDYDELRMQS